MAAHHYLLADVFTDRRFGGNPLAVFPDADPIPPDIMPLIARELNLSETVFVLPPAHPDHTARLRIFTPGMELPFAGHPTVGTACILAAIGSVPVHNGEGRIVFEEGVGPVPVRVRVNGGALTAQFVVPSRPEVGPDVPDHATLAQLLSVAPDDIGDGPLQPLAVSCGVPFNFVPVRNRQVLARVRLNLMVWEEAIARSWAKHVYLITRDCELPDSTFRVRMFAPAMGIGEDPATGAAAATLPGYLHALSPLEGSAWRIRIEQGTEMGRPSRIDVEADVVDGELRETRVAGQSVIVGRGEIDL